MQIANPLKIGIYSVVAPSPHTGVGRQLDGLLKNLPEVDPYNEYLIYTTPDTPFSVQAANFNKYPVPVQVASNKQNHLFQLFQLPRLAAQHNLDLLHIPNSMPLLFPFRPSIVTIYDLVEFALPKRVYTSFRHSYRRLANWLAARRADAVITTSHNTKKDIVRYLGVPESKVQVIYPGIDHEQFRPLSIPQNSLAKVRQKYDLPERFLIYVGKIQPRKNLNRLLKAFHQARQTFPDVYLVLAGAGGWMNEILNATMEQLNLKTAIRFTGFVDDEDLPLLYNMAEAAVFPSLYEGFGFPVVEAMACGAPVITSTTSSLGEIAADSALCIDPTSIEEITAAIQTLLSDQKRRNQLRQRGFKRAATFTWPRCAQATLAWYQQTR